MYLSIECFSVKGEFEYEDEVVKCKQEDELMVEKLGFGKWGVGINEDGGFTRAILLGKLGLDCWGLSLQQGIHTQKCVYKWRQSCELELRGIEKANMV